MTTEQIEMTRVIAEYDGWKYYPRPKKGYASFWERNINKGIFEQRLPYNLVFLESLDLLHPVAMKVIDELKQRDSNLGTKEYMLIHSIEKYCYVNPINGQYIDLFTSVYNGIVFLNEQNVKP